MSYPSPMEEEEVLLFRDDPRRIDCPTCYKWAGQPCWDQIQYDSWTIHYGFHPAREEAYKRLKTRQLLAGESDE